jgi:hypothetical protein
MRAIEAVTAPGETAALCQSVGVSRASLYRHRQHPPPAPPKRPRTLSPRALGSTERQAVLDVLHSERFVDQSPADPTYANQGQIADRIRRTLSEPTNTTPSLS